MCFVVLNKIENEDVVRWDCKTVVPRHGSIPSPIIFNLSDLFWCNFLYLVTTIGFVADQLIM